jgi:hypothetical protein
MLLQGCREADNSQNNFSALIDFAINVLRGEKRNGRK